jgi:hypothetical protein
MTYIKFKTYTQNLKILQKMKKISLVILFVITSSTTVAQENIDKFIIDTIKGLGSSFLLSSSDLEKDLNATLLNIENNCCSTNFDKKDKLMTLKEDIELCKNNKCYENVISTLDFRKSDKFLLQKNLEEAEKLLIENTKSKINLTEKNNLELQKNIESIMDGYEKKISRLEQTNKKLEEELSGFKNKKTK